MNLVNAIQNWFLLLALLLAMLGGIVWGLMEADA